MALGGQPWERVPRLALELIFVGTREVFKQICQFFFDKRRIKLHFITLYLASGSFYNSKKYWLKIF